MCFWHTLCCFTLQRLNVRCNPLDVFNTIKMLNPRQRAAIGRKGFADILRMKLDGLGSRSLLAWLMDKLNPADMTIRAGPGKELKITKDTVRLILGLPCAGGGKPKSEDPVEAAERLRTSLSVSKEELGIRYLQKILKDGDDTDPTIRCFFFILFNRLLFPTASWDISNNEVVLTEQMERFPDIDWCQLVFNCLCDAARRWHRRDRTKVSTTIYGCSIVILVSVHLSLFCFEASIAYVC